MVQTLLADRFKLRLHRETKELPVWALVVAKSGINNGPDFHLDDGSCAEVQLTGPAIPVPGQPLVAPCGNMLMPVGQIIGRKVPMSRIAIVLSTRLGRTVVDRTGLSGNFDVKLKWTPGDDELQGLQVPPGALEPEGPTIFAALQEQLGLKLEAQKGPIEVLVIDHAEKPTEN